MSEDEPKSELPDSWWLTEVFATLVAPTRRATITMALQAFVTGVVVALALGLTLPSMFLALLVSLSVVLANSLGWTQGMLETYETLRETQRGGRPPEGHE